MMSASIYKVGIDIGSTTIKIVAYDPIDNLFYSKYKRHLGKINESFLNLITELEEIIGNSTISISLTGSAGMGISEKMELPFIQELIAASEFIENNQLDVHTLIDIGGEDSKIIFFEDEKGHDLRMNSSCAGGTGSFIDQMSNILNLSLSEIDSLASQSDNIHSIASRCGVFAKTDVQNLIARKIPNEDICLSIFSSLSKQVKNTLLRGKKISPKVMLTGGPLTYLNQLRNIFLSTFEIVEQDLVEIDNPELLSAKGAAQNQNDFQIELSKLKKKIIEIENQNIINQSILKPLFASTDNYQTWKLKKNSYKVSRTELKDILSKDCYLGIDSGSTTTKIVLIDENHQVCFNYYANNNGKPIETVLSGLNLLKNKIGKENPDITIAAASVTGYGEELIKSAFNLNFGVVETIAHFRAAHEFDPNVSFILDIGGQDMKAIFIENGIIKNIEINEACSSGCGTFIENFANSLDYTVEKFSEIAIKSSSPCELGTRCTVFMNSKVKQSFREGVHISDISAGLAYSVVNNCLNKVLNIYDSKILGDNIIVQGGTFKNDAVHKAFENITRKNVICPDISELMGAYGAALIAKENCTKETLEFDLNNLSDILNYNIKYFSCKSCDNKCKISKIKFHSGNIYYTGNRCENFLKKSKNDSKGVNFVDYKLNYIFDRKFNSEQKPLLTLGIPKVLNIYENYPFWHKLFTECGIKPLLSDFNTSSNKSFSDGTLMSDNICYPAKIVHEHINNLSNKKIDRIFYPVIVFEKQEIKNSTNCFNCPVVTGYPDVIKNSMEPETSFGIPIDTPPFTFKDEKLLLKNCISYLKQFDIDLKIIKKAFHSALREVKDTKRHLYEKTKLIFEKAEAERRKVFLLNSRPYQLDKAINHGIPEMIANFGYDVISDDVINPDESKQFENSQILTQWSYPNKAYNVAQWTVNHENIEVIQLNSFGCGPDTVLIDEIKEYMEHNNKSFSVIRIDEHSAIGSIKLRIRSLLESLKIKDNNKTQNQNHELVERKTTRAFEKSDRKMTIIVPFFSPFHSAYASAAFYSMGYNVEQLPESNEDSVELGLKYVNNEICYPAILVIGDILKALNSGKYDLNNLAVGITQTGGQCRASNYVSLLKKALVKNGYEDIPVIGVTLAKKKLNHQPGFKLQVVKFVKQAIVGLLYGDAIQKMYYATKPREKIKGTAELLSNKYANLAQKHIANFNKKELLNLLENAVKEFNSVELARIDVPKVGIVGEVYVKYNHIGNNHSVEYLLENGIEPVLPPLIDMFSQWFANIDIKNEFDIEHRPIAQYLTHILEKVYDETVEQFDELVREYKFYIKDKHIQHLAKLSRNVVNPLTHYFGEGWLIAGDILAFAEEGIYNVLCLQPFGCIANHIIAKGIENKLKQVEPKLNILFLDIDFGISQVNIHNRLYLLIKNAQNQLEKELELKLG